MEADRDYVGHVYARVEGLVAVLVSDRDYPVRVAYSLLSKVMEEFLNRYPPSQFENAKSLDFPKLHAVLPHLDRQRWRSMLVFDEISRPETSGYHYESTG